MNRPQTSRTSALAQSEAIETGRLPIVPNIMAGGEKGGAGGLTEMLLAMLVAGKTGAAGAALPSGKPEMSQAR